MGVVREMLWNTFSNDYQCAYMYLHTFKYACVSSNVFIQTAGRQPKEVVLLMLDCFLNFIAITTKLLENKQRHPLMTTKDILKVHSNCFLTMVSWKIFQVTYKLKT